MFLRLWTSLQTRFAGDEGATMVEYGILVALIAAVAIATIVLLGGKVNTTFSNVEQSIP